MNERSREKGSTQGGTLAIAESRYWDHQHQREAVKIFPGGYYVSVKGEMVVTTLGSCVSACVRDVKRGIGGMNHFMLPSGKNARSRAWQLSLSTRYGDYAMERLINEILKRGGERKYLEVKVFGGAQVIQQMTRIGQRNVEFVRRFLQTEGIEVHAEDLGGIHPRKIHYFPDQGRVLVKKLRSLHDNAVAAQDMDYLRSLENTQIEGDVELFE